MKHKLTERQLTGLLAVYFGQRPSDEPRGTYGDGHEKAGQPYWVSRTSMGGAVRRMCDGLRDNGFLTDWDNHSLRDSPYYEQGNQLTVKGYEALEERLGKFPKISPHWSGRLDSDFFNEMVKPEELGARKQSRADREAEIVRLRKEELDAELAQKAQWRAEYAAKKLAKLRELFKGEGLADNWSDEKLLDFADKVASV
jgi:hypothetical protein